MPGELTLLAIEALSLVIASELNAVNSNYVIAILARTCDGCFSTEFEVMLTGPSILRVLLTRVPYGLVVILNILLNAASAIAWL